MAQSCLRVRMGYGGTWRHDSQNDQGRIELVSSEFEVPLETKDGRIRDVYTADE